MSMMQLLDYYSSSTSYFEEGLGFCVLDENNKIKYSLCKSFKVSFLWFKPIIDLISF